MSGLSGSSQLKKFHEYSYTHNQYYVPMVLRMCYSCKQANDVDLAVRPYLILTPFHPPCRHLPLKLNISVLNYYPC